MISTFLIKMVRLMERDIPLTQTDFVNKDKLRCLKLLVQNLPVSKMIAV
jgi:hypothetical protein